MKSYKLESTPSVPGSFSWIEHDRSWVIEVRQDGTNLLENCEAGSLPRGIYLLVS